MIRHGLCVSAKAEFLSGVHQLADRYVMALYDASADIGPQTTHYATQGEVQGRGYRTGGVTLRNPRVWTDQDCGCLTFDSVRLVNATLTAHAAMIYNASKGNRAVAVFDFGGPVTATVGNFDVPMPADLISFT